MDVQIAYSVLLLPYLLTEPLCFHDELERERFGPVDGGVDKN